MPLRPGDRIIVHVPTRELGHRYVLGIVTSTGQKDSREIVCYEEIEPESQSSWCYLCDISDVNGESAPISWQFK